MAVRGDLLDSGSVIGGYRIDALISRGGMGLVYRATNVALERVYALKVIAPELAADSKFQERFRREMRTAASLHHPNVVGIHYAGEHDGMLFFVMDLVTGTDLRQVIHKDGPLDPHRAVELLRQVASALDAAHAVALVHRDVKPANILIAPKDGEEHAYLTDFGLAKRPDTASGLTATGLVVGTADYIAPEQINGERVDARSDTYALGCVLFHMLTGKVPYKRENTFAVMLAHLHEPPPRLDGGVAVQYPAFASVIEKAMAKDPGDRYLSAGDFALDATAALSGSRYSGPPTIVATGEAKPPGGGDVASASERSEVPQGTASTILNAGRGPRQPALEPAAAPERPWFKRRAGLGAIAALLASAIVAAVVIGGGGGSSPRSAPVTVTDVKTTQVTTTTPATATTSPATTSVASPSPAGALAAVNSYWNDVASGNFVGAYSHDAPGAAGESEPQFVASEQQANIQSVQFQGKLLSSSGGSAMVGIVSLRTVDQQNGCRSWTGQYHLSYSGGSWLIDKASLQPHPCA
jgi:serine/threonine protein kinase